MNQTEKMRKLFAEKTLSVDEMEAIAGGALDHCDSLADDSRFLNVLLGGNVVERVGSYKAGLGNYADNVEKAWAKVGVECSTGTLWHDNEYKINGVSVSQEQARQHAMNVVGRQLKKSDWYWPD